MTALPRALEIIFEVQRKKSNEKINKKKKNFSTCKTQIFFFSFSLDPPYFQTS
jgi:hypothetical protein